MIGIKTKHGCPGETRDTVRETISNAARLEKCIIFPFAGVRIYPGTGVYAEAAKDGLVSREADCLRAAFYFAEGLGENSIREMVEGACGGARQRVLSAGNGEREPQMRRFREHGIKPPMWEYLMA